MSLWITLALTTPASAGPVVTGTLGGDDNSDTSDWCYKLDVVDVTNTAQLVFISPWLDYNPGGASGANELYFVLYEETAAEDWTLIWDSGPRAISLGGGIKNSPAVDVILDAGTRYAMGVWFPDGNYDYHWDSPGAITDLGWGVFDGSLWTSDNTTYTLQNQILGFDPDPHAYEMDLTAEILDVDGDGSLEADDCDDNDALNFPGNVEYCDGLDNDCTGAADDPVDYIDYFPDADADGYGDDANVLSVCDGTVPADTLLTGGDCNDLDANIRPDVDEYCDGIDDNCDGLIDNDPIVSDGWADLDGDTYGDPAVPTPWCERELPLGVATNDLDCDDTDALAFPDSVEVCDGRDDDCDGLIDEGLPEVTWWTDADGDGSGDLTAPIEWCDVQPPGGADDPNDCDDTNAARFPGNEEVCDGLDNDCDGLMGSEGDFDQDGWLDCEDCGSDDASVFPGAPETCDGIDHDCDGVVLARLDCDPAPEESLDVAGCGCSAVDRAGGPLLLLLLAGLTTRRRR